MKPMSRVKTPFTTHHHPPSQILVCQRHMGLSQDLLHFTFFCSFQGMKATCRVCDILQVTTEGPQILIMGTPFRFSFNSLLSTGFFSLLAILFILECLPPFCPLSSVPATLPLPSCLVQALRKSCRLCGEPSSAPVSSCLWPSPQLIISLQYQALG